MGIREILLYFNLWWWYSRSRTCSNPAPANVGLSYSSNWAVKYTIGSENSLFIIWRSGNAWTVVYRCVIFHKCGTHWHDLIISQRGEGWAHTTNLVPPLFIVPVPSMKRGGHVFVCKGYRYNLLRWDLISDLFRNCGICCLPFYLYQLMKLFCCQDKFFYNYVMI